MCVVWEGTHDIYFGATAGEAFDRLADYCRGRQAAGFRVVVLTVLPRAGFGEAYAAKVDRATHEARRLARNARLLGRSGEFADDPVDVAGVLELRDCSDKRSFAGGVHLTPEGYGIAAAFGATAVRGLRGKWRPVPQRPSLTAQRCRLRAADP